MQNLASRIKGFIICVILSLLLAVVIWKIVGTNDADNANVRVTITDGSKDINNEVYLLDTLCVKESDVVCDYGIVLKVDKLNNKIIIIDSNVELIEKSTWNSKLNSNVYKKVRIKRGESKNFTMNSMTSNLIVTISYY